MAILCECSNPEPGKREFLWFCPGCKCGHAFETPRWTWNGSFDKPTFSPSLLYERVIRNDKEVRCHTYVRDGMIQFLSDCTHEFAGKTVPLPEF